MVTVKRFLFVLAALFIISGILGGCGYSVYRHASLPFQEISIGLIENRTVEPKLQDKLERALTEEFLKQGISINPSAQYKITGIVRAFDMVAIASKDNIGVEYRVTFDADFTLVEGPKKIRDIKNIRSPFIVSFRSYKGSPNLSNLLAAEEVAEDQVANNVAMEIVGALIYIKK